MPVGVANQSIEASIDLLATFKDNPGRRFVSLWLGTLAGITLAGFLGLDVFAADFAEEDAVPQGTILGVVLTGLVIGLGSSPTHEVITVLQEVKKARRRDNAADVQEARES